VRGQRSEIGLAVSVKRREKGNDNLHLPAHGPCSLLCLSSDASRWRCLSRGNAQIYRYLQRRTRDADQAEDLAQEVFADAAAALSRGDWRPASMLAWLYTIAHRRFADEVRRRGHSADRVFLDDFGLDELPAPEYGPEIARSLREAIARLSPDQRRVICMKLLRGCSFFGFGRVRSLVRKPCKQRV